MQPAADRICSSVCRILLLAVLGASKFSLPYLGSVPAVAARYVVHLWTLLAAPAYMQEHVHVALTSVRVDAVGRGPLHPRELACIADA